ncbi:HEAT repeat domain-containing protein [Cohnella thermotolerans]|uniref:HEAT repeat domain-containing protein n=1 Tax=Cohnella thermotolerans TaxID=329858 RepID=UPI0003F51AD4|nr:HEAT repeat domain-containing protein [Cohnella thermotolerans]
MHSNLHIAYAFIAVLLGVIVIGLTALYTMKVRDLRRRKAADAYLAKHGDWFTYVLANLDGEEKVYPPPGPMKEDELRVVQERLIGWIEQFRGEQQRKLIALCEGMGLVERQLKRLDSPFEWVKLDAAYYLGCMRSHQAVPGMMKLLASMRFGPMVFIVGRAIAKCAKYTEELRDMVHLLLAHKKEAQPLIADILAESELDCTPMLETFLRSGDPDRIRLSLAAMQKRPLPGSADRLFKLTAADEPDIRQEAARLLLKDPAFATEERVRKLLTHHDGEVRARAARAAGAYGLAGCIGLLRSAMADPEWKVRHNAARSLASLGEEGFAALCAAAETEGGPGAEEARDAIRKEMKRRELAASGREPGWVPVREGRGLGYEPFFGQKELLTER